MVVIVRIQGTAEHVYNHLERAEALASQLVAVAGAGDKGSPDKVGEQEHQTRTRRISLASLKSFKEMVVQVGDYKLYRNQMSGITKYMNGPSPKHYLEFMSSLLQIYVVGNILP